MRQLANAAGISNSYLSQSECGLDAPSDAVLEAIAQTLNTSIDQLYSKAVRRPRPGSGTGGFPALPNAIRAASELTTARRRAMAEICRAFLDANTVR